MEENKKSASPKTNCGYRSYRDYRGDRGYREDSTAGVWRGQGLFMVRHLEMAVFFAIMWGWQNGGGWGIFWKNAKKWGESVEFFCIFCNFA